MHVPTLSLDGTFHTRAAILEQETRDSDEPGRYSPRQGDVAGIGGANDRRSPVPRGVPTATLSHTTTNTVKAEEAAMGITDPDMALIQAGKGRHGGAGTALVRTDSAAAVRDVAAAPRRPVAMATLVEHLQARQRSPSGANVRRSDGDASVSSSTPAQRECGNEEGRNESVCGSAEDATTRRGGCANGMSSVVVHEAYVLGQPFKQYVARVGERGASVARQDSPGATTASRPARFRQNPSQYISALTTEGDYIALGDRAGRVTVMRRPAPTASQQVAYLDLERRGAARMTTMPSARTKDPYVYFASQQVYSMAIDPLYSDDVTPTVTAVAFLPHVSPAAYLLTANEKVPKLYKVMSVRQAAAPFRAVDKVDAKTIGPLTAASRASTTTMKCVSRYALNHENSINSICPLPGGDQFVTADDLSLLLWCVDHPDTSIETYDLRPPAREEVREAIRCVRTFPHEPFLLFVVTSAGCVRVLDTRQALRWTSQTPQLFLNPPRAADGEFSLVTNSLSDCALSPCGRYIAGRDLMTVSLWDVRVAASAGTGPWSPRSSGGARRWGGEESSDTLPPVCGEAGIVRQWALHPHLHRHLEALYNLDLFFKPFDIQFTSRSEVCTGGFNGVLYTIDVTAGGDVQGDAKACGVRAFQLPPTEGAQSISRTPIMASPVTGEAESASSATPLMDAMELGACITLLSRPMMSVGGVCGMVVACGQVAMQLRYDLKPF